MHLVFVNSQFVVTCCSLQWFSSLLVFEGLDFLVLVCLVSGSIDSSNWQFLGIFQ